MSTKRSQRTATEILDAAWALVSERGAEASMAEIAKAAGVSRQAVHLHFGTRGGLLNALVKRADERFEIRERFFAAAAIEAPRDRLLGCLAAWFEFAPKIAPVARDLIRLRATDPDAAAAWEGRMTDLRAWWLEVMESLARDGALNPSFSAQEAADYAWSASSMQAWDLLTRECGWPIARAAERLGRGVAATLLRFD